MDAASGVLPIKFQEHLQLQALGINAASIGFNTLTFESDRFICVREKVAEQNQVAIIDLEDPENVLRRPISADSAIMNPDSKVIALKAGKQLQIFDLEKKAKLKSFLMIEDVTYWRWLGPSALAMVSDTCVYHWNLAANEDPQKVFDRHSSLAGCQIISYRTDSAGRWLLLVGIIAQHGRVVGAMQLYNCDRKVSQPIEGHTGCFAEIMLEDAQHSTKLFVFAVRTQSSAKLHLVEIDHQEGNPAYPKRSIDISFPPEASSDFPVSMQIGPKFDVVYLVTKYGFIQIFDLETGTCLFANRISSETVFATAEWRNHSGIIGVNRRGQVLSVTLDEQTIVPYLLSTQNNPNLALRLASKNDLPGAEELFTTRFSQLLHSGNFAEAAKVAAKSPNGILRTLETIETLKAITVSPGQMSPLLQYFTILLSKGSLNLHESIELAKPVIAQNKKNLLETWLKENKIECSEELGNIVKPYDTTLALSIYLRADIPSKVCLCFAELGQFSKIVLFAKKVGFQPDFLSLLRSAMLVDPTKAVEFAKLILEDPSLGVDAEQMFDLFVEQGLVQQGTNCLLEKLKSNSKDLAYLQTKVLRVNIQQAPQIADALLTSKMLTLYNREEIAHLCETAGLYQRALEHYQNPNDISRVLSNVQEINLEWITNYMRNLPVDDVVTVLRTLMSLDPSRFTQLSIMVATRFAEKMPSSVMLDIFQDLQSYDGLFAYSSSMLPLSKDPNVHFAYIKSACRTGRFKELEKICRESSSYDAPTVWNFLKEEQLADQLPLIVVADRFNLVHELVLHLYQNNMPKFIEIYVQKVNPSRTPEVIAALLDCGCEPATIQLLLQSVPQRFPLDALMRVLEEREQLALLLPFLQQKIRQESSRDTLVHTALAKIYILNKENPEQFLYENNLYDPLAVGKFAEKREPSLALIAFEKGKLDKELIAVTNDNLMFKQQAKYLVKRRDQALWRSVLDSNNPHRAQLLDQIINVAVVESQDAEDVSVAVKALIAANLAQELAAVLEKILYGGTAFASNKNLQNLLLLTSIKTRPERVLDHLKSLSNYDGTEIAKACVQAGLYEEALAAFKRAGNHLGAIGVLVESIQDFDRAQAFAEDSNNRDVWCKLGRGLRIAGRPKQAIDAYIRADDATDYIEIIRLGEEKGLFDDLLRYLQMARKKIRDPSLDNQMLFTLAKLNRMADLEEFLQRPHSAQLQVVGDHCYQERLFEAAKILYASISNYSRLAMTLVHLHDYNAAVECAKRANSLKVWVDVNNACLEVGEYHLAQVCGLHLVANPDELEGIIYNYECQGLYEQAIALLEASLGMERAHAGIFTELANLYARHQPNKLLDFLKLYWNKVILQKVIAACIEGHLWSELVYLYVQREEHERAIFTMVEHSAEAFDHERMCRAVQKVTSTDAILKAVHLYLEQAPMQVNELLVLVGSRIDPTRIVEVFRQANLLPLIKTYLTTVQLSHNATVNNALNELLLEEEDLEGLRASLARSDKIDCVALAHRLQTHELAPFRRLASHLYRMVRMWREAITVLVQEGSYKEAIVLAAESKDRSVAEHLLRHLAAKRLPVLFFGCVFACYDVLLPDVILELAWRNNWMDLAVPIMCQSLRDYQDKIDSLTRPAINGSGSKLSFAPF